MVNSLRCDFPMLRLFITLKGIFVDLIHGVDRTL